MTLHELKRRVALAPDDAEARFAYAEGLFLAESFDQAIVELERAVAIDPRHANARRMLARAYRRVDRLVPAERLLAEAVKEAPEDVAAREDLADVLFAAGRLDDALLHLEEAIALAPESLTRRQLAASIAIRRRLFSRARRHLEAAARFAPDNAEVAAELAVLRLAEGDIAGAALSPLDRGSEFLTGRTRADLARPAIARTLEGGGGTRVLGDICAKLRQGDIVAAKRLVALAPAEVRGGAGFGWLRAETLLLGGDRDRAREHFAALATAHPSALACRRLGELEAARGDQRAAIEALTRALAIAPDDAEAHESLGDAFHAAGKIDEARASWREALARTPDPLIAAKTAAARARMPSEIAAPPGVIAALGWHAFGGIVSRVEAVAVPGRGELEFTGNVGKQGSEAARVAHTVLKSRAAELGLTAAIATRDLHIHFTDTELAKDGASAGIALALAGLSALLGRPLPPGMAASGEITLQGAIKPVAGLHEKVVAAYLGDCTIVLLPRKNLFDARSLPVEATRRLDIRFVDTLGEAAAQALL